MEDITAEVAAAFDEVRDLLPDGVRFFLLNRAGQTSKLNVVRDVTEESFLVNYNRYREQEQFEIATSEADFADDAAQTSFLGYGVPNDEDKIDLYPIVDAARDKVPPVGLSPTWKFFGVREPNERFVIPDEYL